MTELKQKLQSMKIALTQKFTEVGKKLKTINITTRSNKLVIESS